MKQNKCSITTLRTPASGLSCTYSASTTRRNSASQNHSFVITKNPITSLRRTNAFSITTLRNPGCHNLLFPALLQLQRFSTMLRNPSRNICSPTPFLQVSSCRFLIFSPLFPVSPVQHLTSHKPIGQRKRGKEEEDKLAPAHASCKPLRSFNKSHSLYKYSHRPLLQIGPNLVGPGRCVKWKANPICPFHTGCVLGAVLF